MKKENGNKHFLSKLKTIENYSKPQTNNPFLLAEHLFSMVNQPILILDMNLKVLGANAYFYSHFEYQEIDVLGYPLMLIGSGEWNIPCLNDLLKIKTKEEVTCSARFTSNDGNKQFWLNLKIRIIQELNVILVTIEDNIEQQKLKSIKEIKAKYGSMVNQSNVGIAQADINGDFVFANDRYCDITGRSRKELLKHKIQTITHPEDLPHNIVLLEKLFTTGDSFVIEKRYLKPDGSNVWVINHVDPIHNDKAEIIGVSAAVIDITENKKHEIALRESEERYRLVNKATSEIIYDWEVATGKLFWNEAVINLGYSQEELGSSLQSWHERIHPEDKPYIVNDINQALKSGAECWTGEYRFLKKDGTYIVCLDRGYIARDVNGKAYRMIGSLLDLTERKEHEDALIKSKEALRKSEEEYKALFNSIDEGFCVMQIIYDGNKTPIDYLFLETNPVFEEMTGLKNAQGKTALQLVPGLEKQWIEIYGKVARTGESIRFINEAKSMDDRWFEVFAFRFGDPTEKKVALLFNNITEQKRVEIKLEEEKNKAEKAAKAKEDFLTHMSHEIRTPLNGVIGLANILLQQNPKEEQLENLMTLKFSAETLRALVNDILDFSKIQAGKVFLLENDLHLHDFLKNLVKIHQPGALSKGVDLKLNIDKRLPEVIYVDQLKLSQTLQNLMGNAVKFTKTGFVLIEALFNHRVNDRIWIDFSVTDTGIGISPDKHESIFEVFTQEDSSTMRQYGGTGLGLSISKKLVELMGSKIKLESEPGKGSKFYFSIPVKEGNPDNVYSLEEDDGTDITEIDYISILLVEDVDVNRMVLKQFLSTWWRIMPDEALDGEQAVEMAKKKQYDLILMDIRMPVMDGYQAAQIIKDLPEYKHVPILALTADTAQELKKNPEYGLFTDLILKPVEPHDLRHKILNYGARFRNKKSKKALKDEQQVDLTKLDALMQSDPVSTKLFLEKVLMEFERMRERFSVAVLEQDEKTLDNIEHKAKMMLNLLNLQNIQQHLLECHRLMHSNPSMDQLKSASAKGERMISFAIKSLREKLVKLG